MDRFLIITNKEKDKDNIVTNKIAGYIRKAGKQVLLSRVSAYHKDLNETMLADKPDCAIVLGGDGTIIQTANDLMTYDIPILGVNLGTLGFLAEIEENHVMDALDRLFIDDYRMESRLMIQGNIHYSQQHTGRYENTTGYSLNDIVITRKGFSRIISLGIYVNEELVDNFQGDGVIISTPTGSTAYNLSAGGPIIIPRSSVMVITPICPHSLSPRSIVVPAEDTVKVVVGKSKKTQEAEATVTFDGNQVYELGTDDIITINKSQYDTKLIKLNQTGIYEILRSKLSNNGD
ncbi:NAD(+)/NADH kinase [Mobilitalea sibirica]|uniref:NAD kinase n=1 Tax=Mobilitalea sibirica TaxID=1462919 RepID=A0A8J7HAQ7_9FIRM|nr:NAD(+)/NADH kinase [Mobilitalea sibirica]MBH1940211.1 NAD(+)/NADH kinase [Mobilitalea sibirica]